MPSAQHSCFNFVCFILSERWEIIIKTVVLSEREVLAAAAAQLAECVGKKPDALIALCAGRTAEKFFGELIERCGDGRLSLCNARVMTVTEFEDYSGEESSRRSIERLIEKTDLKTENCVFLSAENYESYDDIIAAAGGLDLAVLGLGMNAHFGYNEPATPYASLTHVQKLTAPTRRQLAPRFGGEDKVPERAYTMGIKTIVSARRIMLIALGGEKAEPVFKMYYGRDDSVVPAAFLQVPPEVTVYLDPAAAEKI